VFGVDGHGAVVLALGVCLDADAARRGVSKYRLAYLNLLLLGANGLTCASVSEFSIDDAVLAVGAALRTCKQSWTACAASSLRSPQRTLS